MKQKHSISIILLFWVNQLVFAQQSNILEAYIQEAFSNNLTIKQQQTDLDKAQTAIRQAKALFYPTLSFDANYTLAAGGRRIAFPIGDLLNPVYGTLNQLTQSNAFPKLENQEIQFLPNNFHETKLNFSAPLYNTDLKYNRKIQEKLFSTKAMQMEAYKQELRYQVTEAYLNHAKAMEAEKIWNNALKTLDELLRFNESLVRNNVATKDIVATVQYEIAKANHEIFALQGNQKTAKAYFNFLLNKDLGTAIQLDSNYTQQNLVKSYGENTLKEALQYNFGARKELDALDLAKAAADLNVTRNELNRKFPDFYVGGNLGFQGFGYSFKKDQAYVLAQFGLSYNLLDGGLQKSKTQEAKLEVIKIEQQKTAVNQQLKLQATTAFYAFETAYNLFETDKVGVLRANAVFNIVNSKYRAGQALLIEYIDAQNRATQAQLQQSLSWYDVLRNAASLQWAVGNQ
jgi:outer membrane protein